MCSRFKADQSWDPSLTAFGVRVAPPFEKCHSLNRNWLYGSSLQGNPDVTIPEGQPGYFDQRGANLFSAIGYPNVKCSRMTPLLTIPVTQEPKIITITTFKPIFNYSKYT